VGACRAEDHLTFSWSRRYRTTRKRPSRFISEMGL
jgi:superfamily I DNA/RNA helicase